MIHWEDPLAEDVIPVVNVTTGHRYLMVEADHRKIGTDDRIAVVEETKSGYLERVFVGRFLEFVNRLVVPRRVARWDVELCDIPEDGECKCAEPHVVDRSEEVERYIVGGVATLTNVGIVRYTVTKIDERGVWGTLIDE